MRLVRLIGFGLILSSAFSVPAYALRCGNQIVAIGDSAGKVHKSCGEPTHKIKDKKVYIETISDKTVKKTKSIVKWTYNFGPADLLYIVSFEHGKVIHIETDGYGY